MTETRTEAGAGTEPTLTWLEEHALDLRNAIAATDESITSDAQLLAQPAKMKAQIDALTAQLHDAEEERDRMREEAENKLRAHDGLVALKNGIPETTGDSEFDEVLRLYPVPAMMQRQWLGQVSFDDLPFLKKQILRFFNAKDLSELLNGESWKKNFAHPARAALSGAKP